LVEEINQSGGKAVAIRADHGNYADGELAVEETVKQLGRLDIVVNNEGVSVFSPVDESERTIDELHKLHAVNTTGVAAVVRAATKYLREGGRVINIGSSFAVRVPFSGFADYSASKAALEAYARGW